MIVPGYGKHVATYIHVPPQQTSTPHTLYDTRVIRNKPQNYIEELLLLR